MHFSKDASSSNSRIHIVIFASIWIFLVGFMLYQKIQYKKTMRTLTQEFPAVLQKANAKSLTTFVMYPKVGKAVGHAVVLTLPDPLIDAFFDALEDAHSYTRAGITVASQDHLWFLEMTIGNKRIQMKCYIPSKEGNIVVGEFLGSKGAFQSRHLFQWYQKYSHRWLETD